MVTQRRRKLYGALVLWMTLISFVMAGAPPLPVHSNRAADLIRAVGRHFLRNGSHFEVHGMNYYPKDFAWEQFWTSYSTSPTATNQIDFELDQAKALGINTVRIFVPHHGFKDSTATENLRNLVHFVDRLRSRDMVAIITLFDFYVKDNANAYDTSDYADSKEHIRAVINALGPANPAVMAWDIKNEIDRDYARPHVDVRAWATEMINYTRELDPNHLITIGFYGAARGPSCTNPAAADALRYDPAKAAEFAASVDFVSMHYFLPEQCFEHDLKALRSLIANKPILLEEFGLATTSSDQPDRQPEYEQAAYYNALLSLSEASDIAGYLFWTLNDFSQIPKEIPVAEKCMGIVRNSRGTDCAERNPQDYSEKPAAEVVRRHYETHVSYLDLFDGWVDSKTDLPPPGWSDNGSEGGAILRGYNSDNPLWSHTRGNVAFAKYMPPGTTSMPGMAGSPELVDIDVDLYPFLTGEISSYTVRDHRFGSNASLHVGVEEAGHYSDLLTIRHDNEMPYTFILDLRKPPLNWRGMHTFRLVLRLVPEASNNGYSATYELDQIGLRSTNLRISHLPLVVKGQ
jgi:hypothetical protein